jgi:hypothetical protein
MVLEDPAAMRAIIGSATGYGDFCETVENFPHMRFHILVGGEYGNGDMVYAFSPNDPIFWQHHGLMDKVWNNFQLSDPRRLTDYSGNPNQTLAGFSRNVQVHEVFDTRDLCYVYAEPGTPFVGGVVPAPVPPASSSIPSITPTQTRPITSPTSNLNQTSTQRITGPSPSPDIPVPPPLPVPTPSSNQSNPSPGNPTATGPVVLPSLNSSDSSVSVPSPTPTDNSTAPIPSPSSGLGGNPPSNPGGPVNSTRTTLPSPSSNPGGPVNSTRTTLPSPSSNPGGPVNSTRTNPKPSPTPSRPPVPTPRSRRRYYFEYNPVRDGIRRSRGNGVTELVILAKPKLPEVPKVHVKKTETNFVATGGDSPLRPSQGYGDTSVSSAVPPVRFQVLSLVCCILAARFLH